MTWSNVDMIRRAAAELKSGQIVNLGIGMPTEVANYLPPELRVKLHTENGLLGMGPFPTEDEIDPQIINAGKQLVTMLPGASVFDSAFSFAMIRGGHVDVAVLGGLEVAKNGDLANWNVPGKMITGMGGAMDLAAGAKQLIVLQTHNAKDGTPKLVSMLTLPATALDCVDRIITELGVFDPTGEGFRCIERATGVGIDEIRARTAAPVEM